MFDAIPSERNSVAQTKIYAECAAALGATLDTFSRAVADAQRAGYGDADALSTAYLSIADPRWDHGGEQGGGENPDDPTRAAIFRHGPRRRREADRHRDDALGRLGDARWQDQVVGDYEYRQPLITDNAVIKLADHLGVAAPEALHRLTIQRCLREQARCSWPADTRSARRSRAQFMRTRLAALGYWPDLRRQLYLPAPASATTTAQPRRAQRRIQHQHRDSWSGWWVREAARGQMRFAGAGWEVAA